MSFQDAMSQYVGRGKLYSVESLAMEAGLTPRRIRSYLDGTQPPFDIACQIMEVMPDGFKRIALEPAGIINVESVSAEDICTRKLQVSVSQLNHTITEARADGIVDHREREGIKRLAGHTVGQILAWFSSGARA